MAIEVERRMIPINIQYPELHQNGMGIGEFFSKGASYIWEKGNIAFQAVTALFFRCISFVFPALAERLEIMWGHIHAIYLRIKAAITEAELQKEIQVLTVRVQDLANQAHVFHVDIDRLQWEKNQATIDRDVLIEQRQNLVHARAPILIERDNLIEENGQLKDRNRELVQNLDEIRVLNERYQREKNEVIQSKELLAVEKNRLLQQLEEYRVQLAQVPAYEALNQHLDAFHDLYNRLEPNGDVGETQLALTHLIPQYKAHRARLHQMLNSVIANYQELDPARIPLTGILRLSIEEMDHIERISQTLHLIDGLRKPLASHLITVS